MVDMHHYIAVYDKILPGRAGTGLVLSILRGLLELKHLRERLFDDISASLNASLQCCHPENFFGLVFFPASQDAILKARTSLSKSHAMGT
jgi:hypothetical protein